MKLRNKLILSCAALAAVATTAFSTTFAWYTSNTTVTAGPLTATTKNSGDDLLMIADGYKVKTTSSAGKVTAIDELADASLEWTTSISDIAMVYQELLPVAYNGKVTGNKYGSETAETTDTAGKLVDLTSSYTKLADGATYSATEKYYTRSGDAEPYTYNLETVTSENFATKKASLYTAKSVTNTTASESDSKVLHFVLFLKNAGADAKWVKMSITGLTVKEKAALPAKSIVDPTHNRTYMGLSGTETSYKVDALRVMGLDVEVSNVTDGANTSGYSLVNESVYDLKSGNSSLSFKDDLASGYSAHSYYNAIMATKLDTTDVYNKDTSDFKSLGGASGTRVLAKVPSAATNNNYLRLDFRVFLNGWDKACFDACQGQAVDFGIKFDIDSNQADS